MERSPHTQLRSLQLLRALAAVSVVYYHMKATPNFGNFGVDVFFVLSGFVIAMVAPYSRVRGFIADRIARIVPLYWVFTCCVFAVALCLPEFLNSTTANISSLLKSLFFIPYYKENGMLHPMLAVGWSLNYEMLFYLIVAVAMLVMRQRLILVSVVLVTGLYSLGTILPDPMEDFLHHTLLFEFLLGMGVYVLWRRQWLGVWPLWLAASVAGLSIALMIFYEMAGLEHSYLELGVPSAALLIALLQLERFLASRHSLALSLGVLIGDSSYALYLSHLYVVQVMRKLVAARFPALAPDQLVGGAVTMGVAVLVGICVYYVVDRPLYWRAKGFLRRFLS